MNKFWDMSVEDAMGINDHLDADDGRTPAVDSDTQARAVNDTYYSRSNIAQLSLNEDSAEDLLKKFSRVGG